MLLMLGVFSLTPDSCIQWRTSPSIRSISGYLFGGRYSRHDQDAPDIPLDLNHGCISSSLIKLA